MKIIWNINPLLSEVILDDRDKEILRLKIIIEQLEERIYGAWFRFKPGEFFSVEEAKNELDVEGLEDEPFNKRIDQLFNWSLEALSEPHGGDCICQPCSCSKCHTEGLLGIDTIAGLGKHQAHKFDGAFKECQTIDGVLEKLDNYNPTPGESWKSMEDQFSQYVPRWREEARQAAVWLRKYQQEHFSNPSEEHDPETKNQSE